MEDIGDMEYIDDMEDTASFFYDKLEFMPVSLGYIFLYCVFLGGFKLKDLIYCTVYLYIYFACLFVTNKRQNG